MLKAISPIAFEALSAENVPSLRMMKVSFPLSRWARAAQRQGTAPLARCSAAVPADGRWMSVGCSAPPPLRRSSPDRLTRSPPAHAWILTPCISGMMLEDAMLRSELAMRESRRRSVVKGARGRKQIPAGETLVYEAASFDAQQLQTAVQRALRTR